jgi:hypothetical protein
VAYTTTNASGANLTSSLALLVGSLGSDAQVFVHNLGPDTVWFGTTGDVTPFGGANIQVLAGQTSPAWLLPTGASLYARTSVGPASVVVYYNQ